MVASLIPSVHERRQNRGANIAMWYVVCVTQVVMRWSVALLLVRATQFGVKRVPGETVFTHTSRQLGVRAKTQSEPNYVP
jgi:hypothetical protein